MKKYDILIVGAGLAGAMIAYKNRGKRILVIEKSPRIGGFCYTEKWGDIDIHKFGCHIFHTSRREIWDWVNSIAPFIPYNFNLKANYDGKIYSLPFSLDTFYELFGVYDPEKAEELIKEETDAYKNINGGLIRNLEDKAISSVGYTVYSKLIKGYTEKQWGKSCKELPESIINRLPVRFSFNTNYFNHLYQGIPENGYTDFISKLFGDSEIIYNCPFKKEYEDLADEIYYSGPIDEYYDYQYGKLDYRSISHEHIILDKPNFQGCAVMNYTDLETPWTRIVEHKHFTGKESPKTWITKEYPGKGEKAYPIEDEKNKSLYNKYRSIPSNINFIGRLGEYRYYNMNDLIEKYL